MSRALNVSDIALLTEDQKSELCNYMNYLIARNNALIGLAHFAVGLSVMGLATFYAAPEIEELTTGDEFAPFFQVFLLWIAKPVAFGIMVAALLSAWKKRVWSLPLYTFGAKQFRDDFNKRYNLDISRLSVKEIWSGVVREN